MVNVFMSSFCVVGYDMQYDLKYAYFNFLQSIHYNSVTEAAQAESCSDDENKDVRK